MILQALYQYYDALAARGEISPPGWCDAKVSFALDIDESGTLRGVIPLKRVPDGGKKEIPQTMRVPLQEKRAVNICANFLCDNSSYFLGVDGKGNPARSLQCFEAAKTLHGAILSGVDSPAARGVLEFFDRWQPENAEAYPALADYLEEIKKGANLVFSVNRQYAQQDPAIREAWQNHCAARSGDAVVGRCLVTGQTAPIARLHPAIKGVQGAQSSGASLVAFNAAAFESYGHELADRTGQGLNAPVSESAAFAYGTVLNRLLADREHVQYIGDTTVVYWAEDAEKSYQDLFHAAFFSAQDEIITQRELNGVLHKIAAGQEIDLNGIPINPKNNFYILGLAPSAARLSVRFFLMNTFNGFIKHISEHYDRLELPKPKNAGQTYLFIPELLKETVNQNSKAKKGDPATESAMIRSVLQGTRYPASLLNDILLRINAERNVTWQKAAILKAYLLNNAPEQVQFGEVSSMPINYEDQGPAFLLGCLFALLEKIQQEAIDNINRTLADKFIVTASATPVRVFDSLLEKSNYHLRKINNKYRRREDLARLLGVYYQKQANIPEHHTHAERANFMIGYYLKRQELWTPKNEKNVKEDADHV